MIDKTTNGPEGPEPANYRDIAHAEAIAMNNVHVCQEIDRLNEKRPNSTRSVASTKRAQPTLHDLAQTNEFVRLLLRRAQAEGIL